MNELERAEPVEPSRVDVEPTGSRPADYCRWCGLPVAMDRHRGVNRCPNCKQPLDEESS